MRKKTFDERVVVQSRLKKVSGTGANRLIFVSVIGGLICCVALAFAVRAFNRDKPAASSVSESTHTAAPVRHSLTTPVVQSPPERVETELITIRPRGFEPSEITRPQGLFAIAVENRSGLDPVELRLDQEGGSRLHDVQVSRRELNWKQGVDLPPGRYVLTEANHPEWSCIITITSR